MKKISLLIAFISALSFSQSPFRIDIDYSRFAYDDTSAYIEFFYAFYPPEMKVVEEGGLNIVQGLFTIVATDEKSGEVAVQRAYKFNSEVSKTDTLATEKSLIGSLGFLLPFGSYRCMVRGQDANDPSKADSVEYLFYLNPVPVDMFSLSDIQIASSIRQSQNTASVFYKNTYEVVPNPSAVFGEALPVVYYYAELYNLTAKKESELLRVDILLMNSKNMVVSKKSKFVGRKNASIVEAGAMNINKLPTGTYNLVLALSDTSINLTAATSKKIFIYNPSVPDTVQSDYSDMSYISSEFASMGDVEVDETFAVSKYIANKKEVQQWQSLSTLDAKRKFLFGFWSVKDLNPATPENEFKNEYFRRVELANKQFGTFQKRGWQTDRGRIFISYGEPSEVDRYPNELNKKPHEIWTYHNLESGAVFVFADLAGFSDYLLLHSTLRGELRDDSWERKVITAN